MGNSGDKLGFHLHRLPQFLLGMLALRDIVERNDHVPSRIDAERFDTRQKPGANGSAVVIHDGSNLQTANRFARLQNHLHHRPQGALVTISRFARILDSDAAQRSTGAIADNLGIIFA